MSEREPAGHAIYDSALGGGSAVRGPRPKQPRSHRFAVGGALVTAVMATGAAIVLTLSTDPNHLPTTAAAADRAATYGVPIPPQDPAGAELCRDSAARLQCYDVGPTHARALAQALATGRPVGRASGTCPGLPAWFYRVTWLGAYDLPIRGNVWSIPSADCLPAYVGGVEFDLRQGARDHVAQMWESAGFYAANETTTGRVPLSTSLD